MHKPAMILLISLMTIFPTGNLSAQVVLFDFDNAPLYASLPIDQTAGGITAHLSATGQGYSIQNANVLGFTPPGFSGHMIYPNSINLANLLVRFNPTLTRFSIMYCVQELACDTSATMRVTAYMNGAFVGTNTKVATVPGTWPVDTLSCIFPQGFDSVVVHYDSPPPPPCQDYGVVFMADNMRVIPFGVSVPSEGELPQAFTLRQNYPNPFNPGTTIEFAVPRAAFVSLRICDLLGREVAILENGEKQAGRYSIRWNAGTNAGGVYFYRLSAGSFVDTQKLLLVR